VIGVSVLIAGLLTQALWDQMCADRGRLPVWFARLRMVLTSLAVLPLLAVGGTAGADERVGWISEA
jgi:hypothetical protein